MIPASGFEARFGEDLGSLDSRPVVAWSDDGKALVCDGKAGRLIPASSLPHFRHVARLEPEYRVIPGDGWLGEFTHRDQRSIRRVVAWLVAPDGFGRAVFANDNGTLEDPPGDDWPTPHANIVRVWHPDTPSADDRQPSAGP